MITGIGDDAAVLRMPPDHELLVTTDFSIENVHFRRDWHRPGVVGWRCLTRGLSDIAAMGGEPQAAFLSLAVTSEFPKNGWINSSRDCWLWPKNTTSRWPEEIPHKRLAAFRRTSSWSDRFPKERQCCAPGPSPATRFMSQESSAVRRQRLARLQNSQPLGAEIRPHFRPEPRVDVGQWLRQHEIPSAMIDVSDGLSTDLEHICQESRVGAEIEVDAIPRARWGGQKQLVTSRSRFMVETTTNSCSRLRDPYHRKSRACP